jgi:hypothetical protein
MKRLRTPKALFATGLLGTIAVGGSLAGYTPIACGCLSPWEEIAVRVKLPKESWREATAAKVQAAFQREYKGEKISWMTLPPRGDCSMIAKRQVRCTHWLWEKLNPQTGNKDLKGYEFTILVSRDGVFESVHVDDIETPPEE